jgi:hypothetical protein
MLFNTRFHFLLVFLGFFAASRLPSTAQVNGVPPSVTSIGFGGRLINGVRPSVTSLGPNGFGNDWFVFGNCCANFLWPANPNLPLTSDHHHHRRDRDPVAIGVIETAYIPYAPEPDEDSTEADSDNSFVPPAPETRTRNRDSGPKVDAYPSESVNAQPATILVFRDGQQSDVLNYAIVGDTLFDFAAGRTRKIPLVDLDLPATRKANDDRGVDFQIPDSAAQQ